MVKVTVMSGKE